MKKYVFAFIAIILSCSNTQSQQITCKLKEFYQHADKKCYINRIHTNVKNIMHVRDSILLAKYPDLCFTPSEPPDLCKQNVVLILKVQFVGTDSFNLGDNIYNYLQIDSTRVFMLACVDKKQNLIALTDYDSMIYTRFDNYIDADFNWNRYIVANILNRMRDRKASKRFRKVIKNINKQQPDVILQCDMLEGFFDHNSFMFIKGDKIFVYLVDDAKAIELNKYLLKYYSIYKIRNLNWMYAPPVYPYNNPFERPTGGNSKSEYRLCP